MKKNANYYKKNADAICERNKKRRHAKKEMKRIIKKINKESYGAKESKETETFQQKKETKKELNKFSNMMQSSCNTDTIEGDDEKMTNCEACGYGTMKTKIVMHLSRNDDCKQKYGEKYDFLKAEKVKQRKEYKRMNHAKKCLSKKDSDDVHLTQPTQENIKDSEP